MPPRRVEADRRRDACVPRGELVQMNAYPCGDEARPHYARYMDVSLRIRSSWRRIVKGHEVLVYCKGYSDAGIVMSRVSNKTS